VNTPPPTSPPDGPVLSVVIPLLNEEAVLPETYRCLKGHLDALGERYEIIFVDDGSTDRSREILAGFARRDPCVRVVVLSRNFGHEMGTTAGLRHARGQAAIVMDADMQDPPELIPEFLARWREGYQVVYGVREERKGETTLKRLTSFLFYRLLGKIADVPIPADTGDFRLMDRRVLDVYDQFHEDPRFFRGLVSWVGFRQIGIPFVRNQRAAGTTKYRYGRLLKLACDTITAFSTVPSLVITLLAGGFALASLLLIALVLGLGAVGAIALEGWMWAGMGFLVLWNVQFACLAVLGEYIVRTHRHTQRRPLFIVDTVLEGGGLARLPEGDGEAVPVYKPSEMTVSSW
jgi:glycosyltransferase involved in cell wall biosynthesis